MRRSLRTRMLGRKVRYLGGDGDRNAGRIGEVVNVYLLAAAPAYTVCLKDGRLIEAAGAQLVVEK